MGPLLWNAILHRVGASEFFVDAPIAVMPASWQDTGSGVFTVAVAALVFGFGPGRNETGRRIAWLSLLCGLGSVPGGRVPVLAAVAQDDGAPRGSSATSGSAALILSTITYSTARSSSIVAAARSAAPERVTLES